MPEYNVSAIENQGPPSNKYVIRGQDIGTIFLIIVVLASAFTFGLLFLYAAFGWIEVDEARDPPVGIVFANSVFWAGNFLFGTYLLLRKYRLAWSSIGLMTQNWLRSLLWALALLPVTLLACWLEAYGWNRIGGVGEVGLFATPFINVPGIVSEMQGNYGVLVLCEVFLSIVVLGVGHGIFFWGIVSNALTRRASSVWVGRFKIAFIFLILYLPGISLGLPFVAALLMTWAYHRTGSLLTPITMEIGVLLLLLLSPHAPVLLGFLQSASPTSFSM